MLMPIVWLECWRRERDPAGGNDRLAGQGDLIVPGVLCNYDLTSGRSCLGRGKSLRGGVDAGWLRRVPSVQFWASLDRVDQRKTPPTEQLDELSSSSDEH